MGFCCIGSEILSDSASEEATGQALHSGFATRPSWLLSFISHSSRFHSDHQHYLLQFHSNPTEACFSNQSMPNKPHAESAHWEHALSQQSPAMPKDGHTYCRGSNVLQKAHAKISAHQVSPNSKLEFPRERRYLRRFQQTRRIHLEYSQTRERTKKHEKQGRQENNNINQHL